MIYYIPHSILCYTVVYCDILWYTVIYCGILWYTVIYCDILWYTVIYCNILWYTVVYCGILWYTVSSHFRLPTGSRHCWSQHSTRHGLGWRSCTRTSSATMTSSSLSCNSTFPSQRMEGSLMNRRLGQTRRRQGMMLGHPLRWVWTGSPHYISSPFQASGFWGNSGTLCDCSELVKIMTRTYGSLSGFSKESLYNTFVSWISPILHA